MFVIGDEQLLVNGGKGVTRGKGQGLALARLLFRGRVRYAVKAEVTKSFIFKPYHLQNPRAFDSVLLIPTPRFAGCDHFRRSAASLEEPSS